MVNLVVVDRLRKTLLNYDLLLLSIDSEIKTRQSIIKLYTDNTKSKKERVRLINAKVEFDRLVVFQNELIKQKQDIQDNLDIILSRYPLPFKKVFVGKFIEKKTDEQLSVDLGMSVEKIESISSMLIDDLNFSYR